MVVAAATAAAVVAVLMVEVAVVLVVVAHGSRISRALISTRRPNLQTLSLLSPTLPFATPFGPSLSDPPVLPLCPLTSPSRFRSPASFHLRRRGFIGPASPNGP